MIFDRNRVIWASEVLVVLPDLGRKLLAGPPREHVQEVVARQAARLPADDADLIADMLESI